MNIKKQLIQIKILPYFTILIVLIQTQVAFSQVSTTFDTDLEGWQVTGDNSAAWEPDTGDPNGCLSVNDRVTGAINYAVAPVKYHGDWSNMTATDSIMTGMYFRNTSGGGALSVPYIFRIAGPGGAAHTLEGAAYYPAQNVWNYYTVSLDANDWVIETGDWNDILSTVNSLRIMGEFVNGGEIVRLDNVSLSSTPSYVFVPCLSDRFDTAGTGDWSFQDTGGASNPGSAGNGGGYLKITDKSGVFSKVLAPAQFLGDWSSLDANGYVTIDLRIISRSGSDLGSQEFIRISGPGGSAYVMIDPCELPASNLVWKTFAYPIDSSTWTVDSGNWSGLLSDVAQCKITAEFYDGTDTIGFDNFGRLLNSCPPVDDTVEVNDPNVSKCGHSSLVGVYNVAHNPLDDQLYGLIRATSGSGGGIYPISGQSAGIRIQAYDRPAHLLFDRSGTAFISEDYDGYVYRKQYNGPSSLWVSGFHSGDDDPFGMIFAPVGFNGPDVNEGDILVSDRGNSGADQIWSFSPDTPESERLVMPDPGVVDHFDLAGDPNGKIYVCDALNANNLYTLDPNGILNSLPLSASINKIYSIVYDSVKRDIYIASGDTQAIYRVESLSGNVTLVVDGFMSLHPCCLEIDPPKRRLWVADNGYNRVYEFCLSGGAAVDISVSLEGSSRPVPSGWEIPLFVDFYLPGADVLYDPDVYHCRLTTTKSGDSAVCQVPGVAAGTYDITTVSEHTLLNVKRSIVIADPNTAINMGMLLEGDAYKDDFIDSNDFNIFAEAWLTAMTEPNFDELADFDRNGVIDIFDFSLLASNWFKSSPIEIP
jgi:hypothetical protein